MFGVILALAALVAIQAPTTGKIHVRVLNAGVAMAGAEVKILGKSAHTSDQGDATIECPIGPTTVIVTREGFADALKPVIVIAGTTVDVVVELQEIVHKEEIVVTATRSEKRIEDEPLRVEVLGREEVEEKLLMTPGDIAMLLSETAGLRVQVTAPALGAASLRVQGLRGRYTQLLADGLPLYGGQSGSIGLLQIPPMDLGQVEVIKGVASSLFGSSALGGVINLVSRRPASKAEHEVLVNQTTQGATNTVLWLSGPISKTWGFSFLGDGDRQTRHDIDGDGWADLAGFRRASIRPRFFFDNGIGRNVMLTVGYLNEDRRGGTLPGHVAPDGAAFVEGLTTTRVDTGVNARMVRGRTIIGVRASGMTQSHTHRFGDVSERDRHMTTFGEVSFTRVDGRHTWVAGGALQSDRYRNQSVAGVDYTFIVPSAFVQDDITLSARASVSASVRADRHNRYGTFLSPRVSLLLRPGRDWTIRVSGGRGYFAPTPLTEETEAVGLSRLRPLGVVQAERARSYSVDANRVFGRVELNVTAFGSRVTHTLAERLVGLDAFELVTLSGPTRTSGAEVLARIRAHNLSATLSYTYTRSTEPDAATGIRGDVPLTPRHTAGLTLAWEREGKGRIGFETYYTSGQVLQDDPYRTQGASYPYFGALAERRFGRWRVFVNIENLADYRQTKVAPLVRSIRRADGRWTVDAWAPLEGRVLNAGVRIAF